MGRAEDLFTQLVQGGEKAIAALISTRKIEEHFLDFKRSANHGGSADHLHEDDYRSLAKCLAGFGNADGGVLVWGIECSKNSGDFADSERPIENPARFAAFVNGAISGRTIPAVPNCQVEIIESTSHPGSGFVVMLIPQSAHAPHQMLDKDGGRYLIRAGSSFQSVPHAVLAGMFGRRPQPRIELLHNMSVRSGEHPGTLRVEPTLILANTGGTVASDVFLSVSFIYPPAGRELGIQPRAGFDNINRPEAIKFSATLKEGTKLAPGGEIDVCNMYALIFPNQTAGITASYTWGCTGMAPERVSHVLTGQQITEIMQGDLGPGGWNPAAVGTKLTGLPRLYAP